MFSDLAYYCLLALSAVAYRYAGRAARVAILALSGILFYTYYAGSAVVLLLLLTLGSWAVLFAGRKGSDTPSPKMVRLQVAAVVVVSVAVLSWFKYGGFLGSSLGLTGVSFPTAPLAISFFVFEFAHVAIERGRGTIGKIGLGRYFAFIFFFPTMIAGPIKRYPQFEEGLEAPPANSKDVLEGVFRIALGLFKKAFIADNLNAVIAEIGSPATQSSRVMLIFAILLYGFRILMDFSGYSDIAIGSARLFGIRVPENFLYPYRQKNIADFWRHWHVSLSSWLTDYVYIPLGGSRGGRIATLRNLFLVMIVSGFWHGAAWNFVLWGAWHGVMLLAHRLYREHAMPGLPARVTSSFPATAISYSLTMIGVWIGWMLFMWSIADVVKFLGVG